MRRGNVFGLVSQVCLSLCTALTLKALTQRKFNFGMLVHLRNLHVMFLYQGHRVKVKVTGAKKRVSVVYAVRGWSAFDWLFLYCVSTRRMLYALIVICFQ